VRVLISEDCAGTGQCVVIARYVFGFDADGLSIIVRQPDTPELLAAATRAADLCPMAAIRFET
jgi:ferredoxin